MRPYPSDSVQGQIGEAWWEETRDPKLRRGSLIWAWVPYIVEVPTEICPIARVDGKDHQHVEIRACQFHRANKPEKPELPVAALYTHDDERWLAYKAKERPAIVLADLCEPLTAPQGGYKPHYQPTIAVAPCFGIGAGTRASFDDELVKRCRRAQYPQYIWDQLPLDTATEASIIRLDQQMPIGRSLNNYRLAGWRMTAKAVEILDDWVTWFRTGKLIEDADLQVLNAMFALEA